MRSASDGNARRISVAGFVVPSTEETKIETLRPWYVRGI